VKVDLHVHTNCSDGVYPPLEVVRRAREGGLDVIAIADHDCVEGNLEAQDNPFGVIVLKAVEITSYIGPDEIHVLGYFREFSDNLKIFLKGIQEERRGRIVEIISSLKKLGVSISEEIFFETFSEARTYTRGHLVFYLLQNNYGSSPKEVFEKYLKDFSVPISVTPADAIKVILENDGIPVWAHPVPEELNKHFDYMLNAGIRGIEAYNGRRGVTEEVSREFVKIAKEHNLFVTAGSDWHGHTKDYNLGDFYRTEREVGGFLANFIQL